MVRHDHIGIDSKPPCVNGVLQAVNDDLRSFWVNKNWQPVFHRKGDKIDINTIGESVAIHESIV